MITAFLQARRAARDEQGYVMVVSTLVVAALFAALAAIGVDTARWAVEMERVQKAADAAALAGVTYMPNDLPNATKVALAVAAKNGYVNDASTIVTVAGTSRPSQLRVTIESRIDNTFGVTFGSGRTSIARTSVADYTAPAPMGSPCNTLGNEPLSTSGAAQPIGSALPAPKPANCDVVPGFWAGIAGPDTDKVQGDQHMTLHCPSSSPKPFGCNGTGNADHDAHGYFFAIHVEPAAVGTPIDVQVFDPAYVNSDNSLSGGAGSIFCASLGTTGGLAGTSGSPSNDYTSSTEWTTRYRAGTSSSPNAFCPGDSQPGSEGAKGGFDTTYVLREQVDTNYPPHAPVISGCTKQFRGLDTIPTATQLRRYTSGTTNNPAYDKQLAQVFHQWVSLCTFTPTRKGDYYLQVRTNRSLGGTAVPNKNLANATLPSVIYTGNPNASAPVGNATAGAGLNAFALRAVPASTALRAHVAVSGFASMPIVQNVTTSSATFNLIRALPNAKGQIISFDFFDAADGASSSGGTVKVVKPTDATGTGMSATTIAGCKTWLNDTTTKTALASDCSAKVSPSINNGQLQHVLVPIPNDYTCDDTKLTGCWFKVTINFGSGTVTDFTTWTANVGGDPVRLIQ